MAADQIPLGFLKFIEILKLHFEEQNLRASRLLLFGSRAKGNSRPESDFDLCIVQFDDDLESDQSFSIPARIMSAKMGFDVDVVVLKEASLSKDTLSPIGFEIWKHHREL
jgi:predicted nucleotidyltransferase